MKVRTIIAVCGLALLVAACAATKPNAFDRAFYDITTNQVPKVVVHTNVVTLTNVVQQEVTKTNWIDQTRFEVVKLTNEIPVFVQVTNVVPEVVMTPQLSFAPNTNATALANTARDVGNLFGPFGALVGGLVMGALGVYGRMRSGSKSAEVLAQVIETGRELLKTTPQGQQLDQRWVQWMQLHQAEAGVLQRVTSLVGNVVDNQSAREVAQELTEMMNERTSGTTA